MLAVSSSPRRPARSRARLLGVGLLAGACVLGLAGCGTHSATQVAAPGTTAPSPSAGTATPSGGGTSSASGSPSPAGSRGPEPAVLASARLNFDDGAKVGVGLPVSVTFDRPVPDSQRRAVEAWLRVTTSSGVTGAWSWITDHNLGPGRRVDFRPTAYWTPGTTVTVALGSHASRHFTVARSLIATVDVSTHQMTVVDDGTTHRIPITAGKPGLDTWEGTMVVMDKSPAVYMNSQTVNLGDAYHDYYYWASHLTESGTYLHQNARADTYAGKQNVTHGCIGLADDGTAKRFYNTVMVGDVVTVVGSTAKPVVATGNGYGDWNRSWAQWLANSALGPVSTAATSS
ncbi:L,D-transpeptidase [Streptacidiphilus rugosus]|uniref:L,D-transpeptidase n=1 Tax=Streptacidiphilus rugosus TaxID=405783 RepID=UPI00068ABF97|nr:L,D-transpeptidase [Streptacidiphilus rugosus]